MKTKNYTMYKLTQDLPTHKVGTVLSIDEWNEYGYNPLKLCELFYEIIEHEPKLSFVPNTWYELLDGNVYGLYMGDNTTVGFLKNYNWSNSIKMDNIKMWKLADVDKVKELLLYKANKDYPMGTKFKFFYNINMKIINDVLQFGQTDGKFLYIYGNFGLVYIAGVWSEIIDIPILKDANNKFWYKKDFKIGDVFWSNNELYPNGVIGRFDDIKLGYIYYSSMIDDLSKYFINSGINNYHWKNFRRATKEEIYWLEQCEKANKFINIDKREESLQCDALIKYNSLITTRLNSEINFTTRDEMRNFYSPNGDLINRSNDIIYCVNIYDNYNIFTSDYNKLTSLIDGILLFNTKKDVLNWITTELIGKFIEVYYEDETEYGKIIDVNFRWYDDVKLQLQIQQPHRDIYTNGIKYKIKHIPTYVICTKDYFYPTTDNCTKKHILTMNKYYLVISSIDDKYYSVLDNNGEKTLIPKLYLRDMTNTEIYVDQMYGFHIGDIVKIEADDMSLVGKIEYFDSVDIINANDDILVKLDNYPTSLFNIKCVIKNYSKSK